MNLIDTFIAILQRSGLFHKSNSSLCLDSYPTIEVDIIPYLLEYFSDSRDYKSTSGKK
jgi:hypothetical protein